MGKASRAAAAWVAVHTSTGLSCPITAKEARARITSAQVDGEAVELDAGVVLIGASALAPANDVEVCRG